MQIMGYCDLASLTLFLAGLSWKKHKMQYDLSNRTSVQGVLL